MTDMPYLGDTTDIILGQEFLTWLWFRSSTGAIFNDKEGRPFTVTMEQRIVVQGGEGENIETASVSGVFSELREARMGLTTGKKVTRALVKFERDPEEWQITLKAADFALGSLKTPKVESDDKQNDDPDAILLEKIALIENCLDFIDVVYNDFLSKRLSPEWNEEVKSLRDWMKA